MMFYRLLASIRPAVNAAWVFASAMAASPAIVSPASARHLGKSLAGLNRLLDDLDDGSVQAVTRLHELITAIIRYAEAISSTASFVVTIAERVQAQFQRAWRRLLSCLYTTLYLRLIRRGALSRRPGGRNFFLALLAASRCFGHRSEPSDHTLPALTSMSVVIGEAARSM